MIDGNKIIAQALTATNIPTFYEYFVDSTTPIPCVTYYENNNSAYLTGDTLKYSDLSTYIKVYGKTMQSIVDNSAIVDDALATLGYKRISSQIKFIDGIGYNLMKYDAVGYEKQ